MAFPIPTLHTIDEIHSSLIKYVVIVAQYQGRWVFCRHKDRDTWEIPGGHREAIESPIEAARRELYEETGAIAVDIEPVGIYKLFDYGLLCYAEITNLDDIPAGSEIEQIQYFDALPDALTYDGVHNYLFSWVQEWRVRRILNEIGIADEGLKLEQFRSEEDGSLYRVWKITQGDNIFVLKKAKENEAQIMRTYLSDGHSFAPRCLGSVDRDNENWLLLEYIPGNDLMRCDLERLKLVLDSLISMQKQFWQYSDMDNSFDRALTQRKTRINYLQNPRLEHAYRTYLEDFETISRTLCHDDLLPFNVIINDTHAVFIDWEIGGILPYPASLARLIAHGREFEDAFFYMKDTDKVFAIDYYFENLVKGRGITYESYRRSMDLALFYEYCEWVYVGNKYGNTDTERFREYSALALKQAEILGF